MLAYNIHELRTQNQKNQSMATWIYLLPSGASRRGPIASQFHSEKMNGAGVCSVIRIVLFLIALSAFIQVLHVLTNFCTSEVSNFQLYALCYTSDTFPWISFLCRMSHYQSEYCRGKPCWHTTFMNSEHRIRRINLWQPGYIYCLLVFQGEDQ